MSAAVTTLTSLAAAGDAAGIVELCEALELELGHELLSVADSATVYKAQMLAHLLLRQTDAARFLWKRLPAQFRDEPELVGLWAVGRARWAGDSAAACAALAARPWAPPVLPQLTSALADRLREEEWATIGGAFKTIRPETLALRLRLPPASAAQGATARGWALQDGCYMPVRPPAVAGAAPGADALRQLTGFVAHMTADAGA
jgi:hypothetical protein